MIDERPHLRREVPRARVHHRERLLGRAPVGQNAHEGPGAQVVRAAVDREQRDAEPVARRLVERFEEVQAKQPVVLVQNIEQLEVKFDVPESIIRSVRGGGRAARGEIPVYATFEGQPGRQFPLTYKEISTKADANTQTFEATFLMEQWERGTVLPGMTATVTVNLAGVVDDNAVFTVPVSAVVGDYKLDPQVWVVDASSGTVSPRPVKVGRLVGDGIEVLEGIEPGMRVVTAGTPFLVEGMQVSLLPEQEQAEARPDDLKYQR